MLGFTLRIRRSQIIHEVCQCSCQCGGAIKSLWALVVDQNRSYGRKRGLEIRMVISVQNRENSFDQRSLNNNNFSSSRNK